MAADKFDELDRQRMIGAAERHYEVKLSKIRQWRKFLQDEAGIPYLILGGYGDWHGIPRGIIDSNEFTHPNGKFLIGKRTEQKIKIFESPLKLLFAKIESLPETEKEARHFNLSWSNGTPFIKEVPEIRFQFLTEIDFSKVQR